MRNLRDLDKEEIAEVVKALGAPGYRAEQIFKWAQKEGVGSFDEMTDIPKARRGKLSENYTVALPEMLRRQIAQRRHDLPHRL